MTAPIDDVAVDAQAHALALPEPRARRSCAT